MGNNLDKDGLLNVLKEFGNVQKKKELDTAEVNNEWKRLARFMSGRK